MKKYLSFFTGAMGLDLGLEQSGWHCLSANEIDKKICETIKANKKDHTKLYDVDIRSLSSKKIMKDLNIKKRDLFAIVGGPPCQAFSTAGKRMGLDDERGNVFLHYLDIATELEPEYIVMENVRGLLSCPLKHVPHKQRTKAYGEDFSEVKGGALDLIISILEEKGYTVNFNLYDMSLYGVPQKRERVIIIAHRDGKKISDIYPTHKDEYNTLGKYRVKTVRDTIENIISKECTKFSPKRLEFFKMLSDGENWKNLPSEEIKKKAMGNSYYSGGGKTGFFRRLSWDKPSPTLVTSPAMMSTALCHPSEDRPLSVEEYKALQTFPKNFILKGSIHDKYKQLGNAIPCRFGKLLGEHLNKAEEGVYNLSLSRYKNTSYDEWRTDFLKRLSK